jgi:hypothetical protein
MSTQLESAGGKGEPNRLGWAEFLESQPPNQIRKISEIVESEVPDPETDAIEPSSLGNSVAKALAQSEAKRQPRPLWLPPISLHCDSGSCGGIRFFDPTKDETTLSLNAWKKVFLTYHCRHCRQTFKVYAVKVRHTGDGHGEAMKYGEMPPFGPHIPTKMFSLLGQDQELFRKGSRAESQGMGIGAFAYYRRVVENQKNRLIDEIVKVSTKLNVDSTIIAEIEKARSETRFTKALEILKDALPNVLLIDNHNPLALLHTALSDGLHEQSDEVCLVRAQSIRIVLAELSERIAHVLKEDTELKGAVSKLLQVKTEKPKPSSRGNEEKGPPNR